MHEYTAEAQALLDRLTEMSDAAPTFATGVAITEAREAVAYALADIEDKAVLRYREGLVAQVADGFRTWLDAPLEGTEVMAVDPEAMARLWLA